MWTISYRGMYIHGYHYKEECHISYASGFLVPYTFKSVRAAKCAVTRHIHKAFGYQNIPKPYRK